MQIFQFNQISVTIQGFASCGSPSLFAMSTQGVRRLLCWLVAPVASGSSLEMQESTSKGLDVAHPAALSTAWIWATSDLPPSVCANVLMCVSFNNQSAVALKIWTYHLTPSRLCIGYVDETIHHLAHLLDLRGRAVDGATRVICSFNSKKFTTDDLLLNSGSFPLCPGDKVV